MRTGEEPYPNIFMAVPTVYVKLIEELKNQSIQNINLDHMRLMVSGSAAMPRPIAKEWETLTGVRKIFNIFSYRYIYCIQINF